jgi:DNA-binding transcriptional MocR family regulator
LLLYIAQIVAVKWNIVTMTSWVPSLSSDRPRYVAIADAIAADLATGRLKSGERLPPQRELAWKLGVTVGTVTRAYQEAEKRGLLSGEVGRGSFLRDPGASLAAVKSLEAGTEPGALDMQMATPPRVHQQAEFDSVLREIGRDPGFEDLLEYGPAGGSAQHRLMGSRWLARAGLDVPPERLVISAGAQACLLSCLSTIANHGDRMLIEPLTYPTIRLITRQLGLALKPLEADDEGIIPESLDELARRGEARLLYLVPTLHNPTTVTLSRERREAIAEIAKRHDLTIIEDDVFRYLASEAPPTLYSLAPERTYYIQSASKTMAAGLRIGFMGVPLGAGADIVRQQMIIGGRPVSLALEVARRWIESGVADGVLSRIRAELLARRTVALEVLDGHAVQCEPGSMYVWLTLPPAWRAPEFAAAAQANGVKLTPGAAFAMDHAVPRAVRASLGPAPSQEALRDGLKRLRKLLDRGPVEEFQTMA